MRLTAVCLLLGAGLVGLPAGAAPQGDDWTGRYRLDWLPGTAAHAASAPTQLLAIRRTPDAALAQPVEEDRVEAARWTVGTVGDKDEGATLRRFVPAQYDDFGWAPMRSTGSIECLDGRHLFLCRVKPGSTVTLGSVRPDQEKLQARTGLFGIRLHAGAFELTKLDSTP